MTTMTAPTTTPSMTPQSLSAAIVSHWSHRADLDWIREDLQRRGRPLDALTLEDLAPHDQLHAGGLEATRLLAQWAQPPTEARVLDLGAGLGGAARYLATTHGCRVMALDISPALTTAGREMTRWMRLSHQVEHCMGEVEALSTEAVYDLFWLQHLDIHLAHKAPLYRSLQQHVARGSRLVWHDWLAGPGGEPHYPLPWSHDGALSFIVTEDHLRAALADAGWQISRLELLTERTLSWYQSLQRALERNLKRAMESPSAQSALSGDEARRQRLQSLLTETRAVLRSLEEDRLRPFFGEALPTHQGISS